MRQPDPGATERPLLDWLLGKFPDTPKKRAKQWITAGRVSIDGAVVRKPHELIADPGAALELLDRHATALECGSDGWQIHPRVNILFLDSALVVVNKGPGLLAVSAEPGDLSAQSILTDFLRGKLRPLNRGSLPPAYRQLIPLPVHRLDLYTSGVFCMAMNRTARARLITQLGKGSMQRQYVAYVDGQPSDSNGTWRDWLSMSEDGFRQFVIAPEAARRATAEVVEAITHYEVVETYRTGVSKLRLRLETGRKHQIRAQAARAGVPLLGDRTYHPDYRPDSPRRPRIALTRQALHAETLTFEHPEKKGAVMSWTAALPTDLARLESGLRRGRP